MQESATNDVSQVEAEQLKPKIDFSLSFRADTKQGAYTFDRADEDGFRAFLYTGKIGFSRAKVIGGGGKELIPQDLVERVETDFPEVGRKLVLQADRRFPLGEGKNGDLWFTLPITSLEQLEQFVLELEQKPKATLAEGVNKPNFTPLATVSKGLLSEVKSLLRGLKGKREKDKHNTLRAR